MSETKTGLMGEMFAAGAVISQEGWTYAQAAQDKIDGVAISTTDNLVLRVQVKTASLLSQKGKPSKGYHFQLGSGLKKDLPKNTKEHSDYDILVLCAAQQRLCLFYHVSQVCQKSKRLRPSNFTVEAEADSWRQAVQIARDVRL